MQRMHRARLEPQGVEFDAAEDVPLLIAAERAGIEMASSCRNGTCRTCICFLEEGRISYRIDWPGLSREEKAQGWILPCIAYPQTDVKLSACDQNNI